MITYSCCWLLKHVHYQGGKKKKNSHEDTLPSPVIWKPGIVSSQAGKNADFLLNGKDGNAVLSMYRLSPTGKQRATHMYISIMPLLQNKSNFQ